MAAVTPTLSKFPPAYRETFPIYKRVAGVACFAIAVSVVTFYVMAFVNQPMSHIVTAFDPMKAAIGFGVTAILVAGAGAVIIRAKTSFDPVIRRSLIKSPVCQEVVVSEKFYEAYFDRSTLDANGEGRAYLYRYKDCGNHYAVSISVTLAAPLMVVPTIVFHTLRFCVIPFYVAGRLIVGGSDFKPIDLIKEPGKSLLHIVKAPFFTVAFFYAAFLSLFKPMEGRILGAKIERDWNHGTNFDESYWSVNGGMKNWDFWKRGEFNGMLAGCWLPYGYVDIDASGTMEGKTLAGDALPVFTKAQAQPDAPVDSLL